MTGLPDVPLVPFILASLLSAHGLRKKSLSLSGAITAFIVGFLTMSGGVRAFGVTLIGFYLIGSRATKYGKHRKAELEDGYEEGGYRSGWQVLCNSATALVAVVVWNATFVPASVHAWMAESLALRLKQAPVYDSSESGWCPLDRGVADGFSRALVFITLGHFGCCLGDTLASELGILSQSQPRLVTTFKRVPPGTNGGMSLGGTLASLVGGMAVGVIMGLSLTLENWKCSDAWSQVVLECVGWGTFAGGFGSLIDSLMGATIQQTRYSVDKKMVLQDEITGRTGSVKVISGLNILTNNQVNLLSSVLCAISVAMLT